MAQKSSIEQLPEELQKALHKLLRKPKTTIDEATAYINKLTQGSSTKISRSAMARYKKRIDVEGERLKQARVVAQAIVQEHGEDTENAVGRLLLEKLRVLVFDMFDLFDEGNGMGASDRVKTIKTISETLHHIEVAASASVEREKKIRKLVVEEAERTLKKSGLGRGVLEKSLEAIGNTYGIHSK